METLAAVPPCPIDTEIALQRLNGDRAMLESLASFFLEDAPKLVEALHSSIQSGSLSQIVRSAHSLSGLASTFEATTVTRLTSEIERKGRQGDTSGLAELMLQLDAEFASLTAALQELISTSAECDGMPVR